jgi:hypothetical protein
LSAETGLFLGNILEHFLEQPVGNAALGGRNWPSKNSRGAIASEYAGRIRVGKVDIDKSPATARRYGIDGTPTVMLFKEGKVVGIIDGLADKAEVVRMQRSGL